MCLEAFQSHPLDGQLDSALVVDAIVFFIINVSGQAKVCHLHSVALVQPVGPKTPQFDFSKCSRTLSLGSRLSFLPQCFTLTCSSWQQGLDGQTSCWPDTPSLWPPAARSPLGPSPLGSASTTIAFLETGFTLDRSFSFRYLNLFALEINTFFHPNDFFCHSLSTAGSKRRLNLIFFA